MHLLLRLCILFALVISLVPAAGCGNAPQNDLQGAWVPSAAEMAGLPFPEEARKMIKLVVEGDKWIRRRRHPAPLRLDPVGVVNPARALAVATTG